MIPKIIHYCWFGGNQKPEIVLRCIESWKEYCPDYEIIEWNEKNFDVNCCQYAREAYEEKRWAFVSDYARLCVLIEYGGIYLDTDMELLKPIDELLEDNGLLAFEAKDYVCLGIIGAVKNHSFIQSLKSNYDNIPFIGENGDSEVLTNVRRMRQTLLDGGLKNNGKKQVVCDMTIYPQKLFFPYNLGLLYGHKPRKSYAVHYTTGLWGSDITRYSKMRYVKIVFVNRIRNIIGTDRVDSIKERLSKR